MIGTATGWGPERSLNRQAGVIQEHCLVLATEFGLDPESCGSHCRPWKQGSGNWFFVWAQLFCQRVDWRGRDDRQGDLLRACRGSECRRGCGIESKADGEPGMDAQCHR